MSEMVGVTVRVVDEKILMEEDRIEDRHELDGHQVPVLIQHLAFILGCAVVSQSLREGTVFVLAAASQVQLVSRIVDLLSWMGRSRLLRQFVSPGRFDG